MIKISLKGLAKFMTGSAASQRKVLRDFKYPDPEGRAQATYYREARDFIFAYHKNGHPRQWLEEMGRNLGSMAALSSGQTQSRYRHNARALHNYAEHFGNRVFEVLPSVSLNLSYDGVIVTVFPDLHVREKGAEKIIKLEFGKDAPDDRVVRIISQAMFEAQAEQGLGLSSSAVLVFDVPRGQVRHGARIGSRMRSDIEAACTNIAAIWDGI